MDKFLVNMAIVRVNLDRKGQDILDNYIPLVHETLANMENDIFSVDEFKTRFVEIAEFSIPTGAVLALLKRAMKKYELLIKGESGTYIINRESLQTSGYTSVRDAEQRKYNQLVSKFVRFCKDELDLTIEHDSAASYFFEVLFDLAPLLFKNISDAEKLKINHSDKNRYLVARFISYANNADQESFESILSFVRGSILTETFYYSQNPTDIENKPLRRVVVYFDTQFLIRLLGFSDSALCAPSQELWEMLKEMQVKMRCFQDTLDEIHGILFAALNQMDSHGRLKPNRPSDIFDYITQNNIKPSDLTIILNTLEEKLKDRQVYVEPRPKLIDAYSFDHELLGEKLSTVFELQSEKARQHDINCLQAVFQIREGRKQEYLDRCKAIFITTNSQLAQLSTHFFNEQYGPSSAAVCMGDHVFASLVWMKSVKKITDLPKDRLVANCYSALLPSESLWSEYIREVTRLQDQGAITQEDYHVLIYGMASREQLMEHVFSSDDNMFGSVEEILDRAKREYTKEVNERLSTIEGVATKQSDIIDSLVGSIGRVVETIVLVIILCCWVIVLGYALLYTSPTSITDLKSLSPKSIVFLVLLAVTLLNLIFGIRLVDVCRNIANKSGEAVKVWIRNRYNM
ncbi:hypothetical protein [Teredinibacter turnerae]|uniref:hypothetical protein n=1 Tax=Teredinibacter turnerae TaxID=2426 RepID=UPI00035E2587|nr:hypothetical protein [Teredinibacter turnerae]